MEVEEIITSNSLHDKYRDRLGTADPALFSRLKTRNFNIKILHIYLSHM